MTIPPRGKQLPNRLLAAFLIFGATSPLHAQQFTVLRNFPAGGIEGVSPVGNGAVLGNKIYGVTRNGGINGMGVLYRVNIDGTGFTKLRDFTVDEGSPNQFANSYDTAANILSSSGRIFLGLYGGAANQDGAIYTYNPDAGGAWAKFSSFENARTGSGPRLGFVGSDGNTIYGVCEWGGESGRNAQGTIFQCDVRDGSLETLHTFAGGAQGENPRQIVDGDSFIFGLTRSGGVGGKGTLFRLKKDGSDFRVLKDFAGNVSLKAIVLLNGKIYGCSDNGGAGPKADGFIFSVNTDGSDYGIVRTFSTAGLNDPSHLATDGALLYACLSEDKNDDTGGLVSLKPDGSGLRTLFKFVRRASNQIEPTGLFSHAGRLYGCTAYGGSGGTGTLWSYEPSSFPLKILPSKRTAASGKSVRLMAMLSNDSMQPRPVNLEFSSDRPGVTVTPASAVEIVPGKKSAIGQAATVRVPLSVTIDASVKGEVKISATDGSFTASPCTLTIK